MFCQEYLLHVVSLQGRYYNENFYYSYIINYYIDSTNIFKLGFSREVNLITTLKAPFDFIDFSNSTCPLAMLTPFIARASTTSVALIDPYNWPLSCILRFNVRLILL